MKAVLGKFPSPAGPLAFGLVPVVGCLASPSTQEAANDVLEAAINSAGSLEDVALAILENEFIAEDPQIWCEALTWVANAVMQKNTRMNGSCLAELGKKALGQANPNVRNAALALIGTVHLQAGEQLNETSARPNPCDTKSGPEKQKVKASNDIVLDDNGYSSGKVDDPSMKRIDISGHITDQLIAEMGDKNWKVRSEALQKFSTIISEASKISPDLGEAPQAIVARISDSNSKISANAIAVVEALIVAMGPPFRQYTKIFLPALLKAIGDTKPWVRTAVVNCLNELFATAGSKEFFEGEVIAEALRSGTTAVRIEMWIWLGEKIPTIPIKQIPKDELVACLPILYSNLEDRYAEVRKAANEVVLGFMMHLGYNTMLSNAENMKGGLGVQMKAALERTRALLPEKPVVQSSTRKSTVPLDKQNRVAKQGPGSSATITKSSKMKVVATRKKEDDVDTSPLLQVNSLKNQRVIDEQKMKTLKWNFTSPRPEFVELLRDQMTVANVNKTLMAHMFHIDFKYHLKAIDALIEDLPDNHDSLKSNLDLILRWMTLRFFDTNPSVLLKGLEYLNNVFNILIEEEYNLLDNEAASFFPYLILKVGDPKDTVRNSVRAIFKQIGSVYSISKQFAYVIEGIKSKNARQRAECLEQLGWLIENYGVSVCHPSTAAALKEIARHIADRDTSVRNAALNCVVTAYFLEGDKILKMVGQISEKDMSLLEERIKRAAKTRSTVVSVKPSPPSPSLTCPPPPSDHQEINNVTMEMDELEAMVEMESPSLNPLINHRIGESDRGKDELSDSSSSDKYVVDNAYGQLFANTLNRTGTSSDESRPGSGPYGLDPNVIDEIECALVHFQAPKLTDIDLQFLRDTPSQTALNSMHLPKTSSSSTKYNLTSSLQWDISQIASPDIEKSMAAMGQVDFLLNSDKRDQFIGFVDYLLNQLVHQLIMLNQSTHPDLVNCYRAIFSLIMKICNYPALATALSEQTLYKVLKQLLLLLTEHKFDRHEMFIKVINSLVLKVLESTNKTNMLCALLKMLYDTLCNPEATKHYQELIIKCLWKLTRTQPAWDAELNYPRILTDIHHFLKDYPTSWWKTQEQELPLRTVKTMLHTMVKLRGMELKEHLKNVPGITPDSELYTYVRKVIRHLKLEMDNSKDSEVSNNSITQYRIPKEVQEEITKTFKMIGDVEETNEAMKRLYELKKVHPEAVELFLSKSAPVFEQFIKRRLTELEVLNGGGTDTLKKGTKPVSNDRSSFEAEVDNSEKKLFTKEAERLWNRLQLLQEQAGCPTDKKSEFDNDENDKDLVPPVNGELKVQREDVCNPGYESIRQRLENIRSSFSSS